MTWLETMRTEAYRGRLVFSKDSELYQEFPQIIYTQDHQKVDDENGLHSDLLDACLYAFRGVYNAWPEDKPLKMSYKQRRIKELLNKIKKTKIGF